MPDRGRAGDHFMNKRPFILFGIFAAVCLIAIPLLALDKEGSEDSAPVKVESQDEDGKLLFVDNCGYCHTLAAAGTDGVVGPDLDDTLAPTGNGNFDANYGRVLQAVTCGLGGRMPAGILTGENAKDIAAFVAAYAGQLSPDEGPTADTETAEKPDPTECAAASS